MLDTTDSSWLPVPDPTLGLCPAGPVLRERKDLQPVAAESSRRIFYIRAIYKRGGWGGGPEHQNEVPLPFLVEHFSAIGWEKPLRPLCLTLKEPEQGASVFREGKKKTSVTKVEFQLKQNGKNSTPAIYYVHLLRLFKNMT